MNSNVWSNNFMPPKDIFDEDEQGKNICPFHLLVKKLSGFEKNSDFIGIRFLCMVQRKMKIT